MDAAFPSLRSDSCIKSVSRWRVLAMCDSGLCTSFALGRYIFAVHREILTFGNGRVRWFRFRVLTFFTGSNLASLQRIADGDLHVEILMCESPLEIDRELVLHANSDEAGS